MVKEDFDKNRYTERQHKKWLDLITEDTGLPIGIAEKYGKNMNITSSMITQSPTFYIDFKK